MVSTVWMRMTTIGSGSGAWELSATLITCAALLTGCGRGSKPARYDVRGTVAFQGQPVPSGSITFEPDSSRGNSGPVSIMSIIDGRFDSRATKRPGPLSGPLVVRITGYPPPDPSVEVQPPLFPEYTTTADLPASRTPADLAFEVPDKRGKQPSPR